MNRVRARLSILADPHVYAARLGTSGPAFEECLAADTKVLGRSEELFDEALALVRRNGPDVLLIPGDLTKDGEYPSHEKVVDKLSQVRDSGIRICVIPGNHDLNNPWAFSYGTEPPSRVGNLSQGDFPELYGRFGYEGALRRDASSLSYVAEPVPGLWILALDVCDYEDNIARPVTSGRLKAETSAWAAEALAEARRLGKTVLGLMHHNLLEHHRFQSLLMGDFIVADWEGTAKRLAAAGLRVVFTGHYHTQDVARAQYSGGRFLFDVETGSTVTYPCPVRFVDLDGSVLKLETVRLAEIPDRNDSLREEALRAFEVGIRTRAVALMADRGVDRETALAWAPRAVDAYRAHTAGDEHPGAEERAVLDRMARQDHPALRMVGQYLEALWTNTPPPDNALTIDLEAGSFD